MRLSLSRTLVATVARRFASQYPADTYPADCHALEDAFRAAGRAINGPAQ